MARQLTVFTPYGREAASARVRMVEWLEICGAPYELHTYIGARNASPWTLVSHLPEVVLAEVRLRRFEHDPGSTLVVHREASPFSTGDIEERLLRGAAFSVYDFDDALQWDVHGGLRRGFIDRPSKTERCVKAADVVVAGSELLADWATGFAKNVTLIPTCVDPHAYVPKHNYELSDPPIVGWVGSPATEPNLRLLTEPLLMLHDRTGARLHVVSRGAANLGALDQMVTRVDWHSHTVSREMASFDIAVAPLRADLFGRGKCAYKILQYAAAALPVIGSATGANRRVVGELGIPAARSSDDWFMQLLSLIEAPASERARSGALARRRVEDCYSFTAWLPAMRTALGMDDVLEATA
jgi:glycosyltransferase involved in cell wall biosynthesis